MSKSACSLSAAVDRAAGSQSRHLIFKPCRHLLGCHSLGSRLQQLNRQAIGALARARENCSVIRGPSLEPRYLRLQCPDLCRYGDVARLATTWWPGRMPYFSKINAYQGFAIIRK
jgi:hypothetical protein